jgi:hypothetical protein
MVGDPVLKCANYGRSKVGLRIQLDEACKIDFPVGSPSVMIGGRLQSQAARQVLDVCK